MSPDVFSFSVFPDVSSSLTKLLPNRDWHLSSSGLLPSFEKSVDTSSSGCDGRGTVKMLDVGFGSEIVNCERSS